MNTDPQSAPVELESDFEWEAYIPFQLVRTQLWMHRILRPESSPSVRAIADVSKAESRVILVVAFNREITPSEISDNIGLDRATVTRAIASLASKELIVTTMLPSDQRSKCVHITTKGKLLCDELIALMRSFDDHLNSVLDMSEKDSLIQILEKLLDGSRTFSDQNDTPQFQSI